MKYIYCGFFFFTFLFSATTQERKIIEAYRFQVSPKIDGIISEKEWKKIIPATNFTLFQPENRSGEEIPVGYETYVYFGYDDKAIYVAAQLNHPDPNNIPSEFSERDDMDAISEKFLVSIDTYDNTKERFTFFVTSSGGLIDGLNTGEFDEEGLRYNTLFDAKVKKNKKGWSTEIIIPYSALRFPNKKNHNWGINFGRNIKDFEEMYVWSPVDERILNYHESLGLVKNIKEINPPTRLFLYPYVQSAVNFQKDLKPSSSYSAGLDLKYGISNSFTIDATLIPDFGQVTFDDEVLNLTPFEQEFDENRPFFTEGADLFKIVDRASFRGGSFFYSRRIGQRTSINEDEILNDGDQLLSFDETPKLLNSIKLTGTTNNNLSIGFINAITDRSYALIRENNDNIRKELITPFTNFNVLSLSQKIINDYSTIGFINGNLNRESSFQDANNYAFMANIFDNKRNFSFKGYYYKTYSPRLSQRSGKRKIITIEELKGNFRYWLHIHAADRYYNQNEIGFYNGRNFIQYGSRVSYQILNKNKYFRNFQTMLYLGYQTRYDSNLKNRNGFSFSTSFQNNNLWRFSIRFRGVSKLKDWYETRTEDRFILDPKYLTTTIGIDSDNTKKFSYGTDYIFTKYQNYQFDENKKQNEFRFYVDYRISEQFSINIRTSNERKNDDVGFLMKRNGLIYFGLRNIKSIENNLRMEYNFNRDASLSLRFRNFWSTADYYEKLFELLDDGTRKEVNYSILNRNPNTNFNIWNLDLNFEWWFAPGSNMVLLYRNQIFNRDDQSGINYYNSLKNLFETPTEHQLSLRLNYLIDYNKIKKNK